MAKQRSPPARGCGFESRGAGSDSGKLGRHEKPVRAHQRQRRQNAKNQRERHWLDFKTASTTKRLSRARQFATQPSEKQSAPAIWLRLTFPYQLCRFIKPVDAQSKQPVALSAA